MSRLNTMTTLVSAGYPAWYAYGVSRGIIDTTCGLRQDLLHDTVAYGECDNGLSIEINRHILTNEIDDNYIKETLSVDCIKKAMNFLMDVQSKLNGNEDNLEVNVEEKGWITALFSSAEKQNVSADNLTTIGNNIITLQTYLNKRLKITKYNQIIPIRLTVLMKYDVDNTTTYHLINAPINLLMQECNKLIPTSCTGNGILETLKECVLNDKRSVDELEWTYKNNEDKEVTTKSKEDLESFKVPFIPMYFKYSCATGKSQVSVNREENKDVITKEIDNETGEMFWNMHPHHKMFERSKARQLIDFKREKLKVENNMSWVNGNFLDWWHRTTNAQDKMEENPLNFKNVILIIFYQIEQKQWTEMTKETLININDNYLTIFDNINTYICDWYKHTAVRAIIKELRTLNLGSVPQIEIFKNVVLDTYFNENKLTSLSAETIWLDPMYIVYLNTYYDFFIRSKDLKGGDKFQKFMASLFCSAGPILVKLLQKNIDKINNEFIDFSYITKRLKSNVLEIHEYQYAKYIDLGINLDPQNLQFTKLKNGSVGSVYKHQILFFNDTLLNEDDDKKYSTSQNPFKLETGHTECILKVSNHLSKLLFKNTIGTLLENTESAPPDEKLLYQDVRNLIQNLKTEIEGEFDLSEEQKMITYANNENYLHTNHDNKYVIENIKFLEINNDKIKNSELYKKDFLCLEIAQGEELSEIFDELTPEQCKTIYPAINYIFNNWIYNAFICKKCAHMDLHDGNIFIDFKQRPPKLTVIDFGAFQKFDTKQQEDAGIIFAIIMAHETLEKQDKIIQSFEKRQEIIRDVLSTIYGFCKVKKPEQEDALVEKLANMSYFNEGLLIQELLKLTFLKLPSINNCARNFLKELTTSYELVVTLKEKFMKKAGIEGPLIDINEIISQIKMHVGKNPGITVNFAYNLASNEFKKLFKGFKGAIGL